MFHKDEIKAIVFELKTTYEDKPGGGDFSMTIIAGVDEAGRGPWAGPVVAAAVVLAKNNNITGLDDSKKLTAKKREYLCEKILKEAAMVAWQFVQVPQIDRDNILAATLKGMERAVLKLDVMPSEVLVDGRDRPNLPTKVRAIIGGDGLEPAIAAASIVAKVMRDRYMLILDKRYPAYGFASHKGYGTKQHQEALAEHGILLHHRKSFAPIRKLVNLNAERSLEMAAI